MDDDLLDKQEEKDIMLNQCGYYSVIVGKKGQRLSCSAKNKDWLIKNAETRILSQVDLAKTSEIEMVFLLNEIREEVRLLSELK